MKGSVSDANDQLLALKKAVDADWQQKSAETTAAIEKAKSNVTKAVDGQALKEDADKKLKKIQDKIESLKADAAKANAEEKKKLDEAGAKLESKYNELKARFVEYQESAGEKYDEFKDTLAKSWKDISETFKGWFD